MGTVARPRRPLWASLAAVLLLVSVLVADATHPTRRSLARCGGALDGFSHAQREVPGARLHYVIGGQGPVVVLLHGFPQTWLAWRHVMPLLARNHTVVVPDLRGVGCSSVEASGYDKHTLAQDVHDLLKHLGFGRAAVVGHDMGGMVAYAYARTYRRETSHVVISAAVLPGFGLRQLVAPRRQGAGLPHLGLFIRPWAPEQLISGRERDFLAHFIASPDVLGSSAFAQYVWAYSRPGRLSAALAQYRALPRDAAENTRRAAPLTMPVLALSGEYGMPEQTSSSVHRVGGEVRETVVPRAGHYLPEERPNAVARAVEDFLRTPS